MEKQEKKRCIAVVLAAGKGKRMETPVQKQYIELNKRPLLFYSLETFHLSELIDDVILVVGCGQEDYVFDEIVRKYHFHKVRAIVAGGEERYDSVWQGLKVIQNDPRLKGDEESYVFIHDGARPFVDEEILQRACRTVRKHRACVAGMPSKDTIKIVDDDGMALQTPDRKYLWQVQTPQVFETALILAAYSRLMREEYEEERAQITDDAMVVERMMNVPVKLFEGSYENIKITTPEDLKIARVFLAGKN